MVDWQGEVYAEAWIYDRLTPSLEHRCLEYHYTKNACIPMADGPPSQSSIDALNTTTPNLADLYKYRTMYIYPCQIETSSQLSIDALNTAAPNLADLYI